MYATLCKLELKKGKKKKENCYNFFRFNQMSFQYKQKCRELSERPVLKI